MYSYRYVCDRIVAQGRQAMNYRSWNEVYIAVVPMVKYMSRITAAGDWGWTPETLVADSLPCKLQGIVVWLRSLVRQQLTGMSGGFDPALDLSVYQTVLHTDLELNSKND